jgi:hypothetical protein
MYMPEQKGWYKRNLPHFDGSAVIQSITFRLADSMPQVFLNQLEAELKRVDGSVIRERQRRIEAFLDQGVGSCILGEPACAKIVQDSLCFLHLKRFELYAWPSCQIMCIFWRDLRRASLCQMPFVH